MPKGRRRAEETFRIPAAVAEELILSFEIDLARAVIHGNPGHLAALQMLGHALCRAGRHREALEVDNRILDLRPEDPVSHYNLACSLSNLKDVDRALVSLERALQCGYRDIAHLMRDEDLRNVRLDPRFRKLVEKRWGRRQSRER